MDSYTAAVITVSDKGAKGQREDTSGPALCAFMEENGLSVVHTAIVSDEPEEIRNGILHCTDTLNVALVLTTGGTGFSGRDNTPEVTREIIEKEVPGIPEAMRYKSMQITDRACLSRSACGIRKQSLVVNLPGSKKAALENIESVISPIRHGLDVLLKDGSANCAAGSVAAVCISEKKGEIKRPVDEIVLEADYGIKGDAHAGKWHRQVSLLGVNSVEKMQKDIDFTLEAGAFAENILVRDMTVYELAIGTRLSIGDVKLEVTQIGKECHRDCAIRQKTGDCVMPREGIFAKVLEGGTIRPGDRIVVM